MTSYPPTPLNEPSLLTIPQVAQQLHICRAHIYTLIKQGLPTIHLGRSVRVSATAFITGFRHTRTARVPPDLRSQP